MLWCLSETTKINIKIKAVCCSFVVTFFIPECKIKHTVTHSRITANVSPLKAKRWQKYPDFKLKEWFSGVIWENPPLSPCWGRKACCKWKNLLLKPGIEPSAMSVGAASPKDSSYLFFLLFMFGTQETKEGFIQDQQKGVDFSNVAINLRQKRFLVRIFECF